MFLALMLALYGITGLLKGNGAMAVLVASLLLVFAIGFSIVGRLPDEIAVDTRRT
jgi:hypothetical protein